MLYLVVADNGNILNALQTINTGVIPSKYNATDQIIQVDNSLFAYDLILKNYDFATSQIVDRVVEPEAEPPVE